MTTTPRLRNRRQQILREATQLFAENGFQGTSMRSIARRCGISEAAIYRHFSGKEVLYRAVIQAKAREHDIRSFLEEIEPSGDIESVLERIAHHILGFIDDDPELLGLMFSNSVETGPVAAVLFREVRLPYIEYLASQIDSRIQDGEVRGVDPFITARCFVGMVIDCALSVGVWNKVTKFDFKARDVVRNNVPIFARGLMRNAVPEEVRT